MASASGLSPSGRCVLLKNPGLQSPSQRERMLLSTVLIGCLFIVGSAVSTPYTANKNSSRSASSSPSVSGRQPDPARLRSSSKSTLLSRETSTGSNSNPYEHHGASPHPRRRERQPPKATRLKGCTCLAVEVKLPAPSARRVCTFVLHEVCCDDGLARLSVCSGCL